MADAKRYNNNWIKAYMEYSSSSESPDDFHFWTAVSVIAGALRRRVWIDMGYFQWTPNFYIIFVAPPGIVSKTTTANIGMRLLKQVEGITFGPNSITWQSLTGALEASHIEVELSDGNYYPMSPMTIVSGEFGTFLDPNNREMVDVLVEFWDAPLGTWERTTKTSGNVNIVNPWLNILACTTPHWISGNFPEYMIGGGFTSRCVFVYAEEKRQLVAYPGDVMSKDSKEQERKLVEDLRQIAELGGSFSFSKEAKVFGQEWYEKNYKDCKKSLIGEKFQGYIARKQSQLHKLAMVLSVADSDELVIEKKHLHTASEILNNTEKHLPKVFDKIGKSDNAKHIEDLMAVIRAHTTIGKLDLFKLCVNTMSFEVFEAALDDAVRASLIKCIGILGTGSKAQATYAISPEV